MRKRVFVDCFLCTFLTAAVTVLFGPLGTTAKEVGGSDLLRPETDRSGLEERLTAGLEEKIPTIVPKVLARFDGGRFTTGKPWSFEEPRELVWMEDNLLVVSQPKEIRLLRVFQDPHEKDPAPVASVGGPSIRISISGQIYAAALPFVSKGTSRLQNLMVIFPDGKLYQWEFRLPGSTPSFVAGIEDSGRQQDINFPPVGMVFDHGSQRLLVLGRDMIEVRAAILEPYNAWNVLKGKHSEALEDLENPSALVVDPSRKWVWVISRPQDGRHQLVAFQWSSSAARYREVFRAALPNPPGLAPFPSGFTPLRLAVDPESKKILVSDPYHQKILVIHPDLLKGTYVAILEAMIDLPGQNPGGEKTPPVPIAIQPTTGWILLADQSQKQIDVLPALKEILPHPHSAQERDLFAGWRDYLSRQRPVGSELPRVRTPWGFHLSRESDAANRWILSMWDRGLYRDSGGGWRRLNLGISQWQQLEQEGQLPLDQHWQFSLELPDHPASSADFRQFQTGSEGATWIGTLEMNDRGVSVLQSRFSEGAERPPLEKSFDLQRNPSDQLFWLIGEAINPTHAQLFLLTSSETGKEVRFLEGSLAVHKGTMRLEKSHWRSLAAERLVGLAVNPVTHRPFSFRWVAGQEALVAIDRIPSPDHSGLEEDEAILQETLSSQRGLLDDQGWVIRPHQTDGSSVIVAEIKPPIAPSTLYLQEGLDRPVDLPPEISLVRLGAGLEEVLKTWREQPPSPGAVIVFNAGRVDEVTVMAWMPLVDPLPAALRTTKEAWHQSLFRVISALAQIARKTGKILEVRSVTYLQVGPTVYAIIHSA